MNLQKVISIIPTMFLKLARACLFAGVFFVCLFFGKFVTTFGLHLYDFLFICVIITQVILILTRVETRDEVKIIMIYHVVGFVMEAFKTHPTIASRAYPDPGFFTLFHVPLYSGFMYSAIGSFIFQAWRLLDLKFTHYPPYWTTIALSILIYANFFTHHFTYDFRYIILIAIIAVARRTQAYFKLRNTYYHMPVLLGLTLTGFFIWIAENLASYAGAWMYPYQAEARTIVSPHKILARFLLFIISHVIVATYKTHRGKNMEPYIYKKKQ